MTAKLSPPPRKPQEDEWDAFCKHCRSVVVRGNTRAQAEDSFAAHLRAEHPGAKS